MRKVRQESGNAKSLSVCGGDQSRATGEGFGEGQVLLQGEELLEVEEDEEECGDFEEDNYTGSLPSIVDSLGNP